MAKEHSKSQAHSCKENVNNESNKSGKNSSTEHFPQTQAHKTRQLTIREAVREPKLKSNRALFEHHPVQLEPYTILRGQWLTKAGFEIGQKITVEVSHQQLIITPSKASCSEKLQATL